jgi:prepilin-type N-terminal cleavage/methylation domain-containing protein
MSLKILGNQRGFTIIELVMVIVIIGILAAVAVPKFVDLKSSANNSVLKGVQGSINGAIVMLHSQYIVSATTYNATTVTNQIQQQGFTLVAGASAITASVDASCNGSWAYNAHGGVSVMATIGNMVTSGC